MSCARGHFVCLVVTVATLLASNARAGTILDVPGDYPTIQAAIDAASEGDEVVVAPGTYLIDTSITFTSKAITLRSASDDPADTILDGSPISGMPAPPMINVVLNAPGTRTIRGFTFAGAQSAIVIQSEATDLVRVVNNRFTANGPWSCLRADGLNVDVIDNDFEDNETYIWGALVISGNATVTGNRFVSNDAIPYQSITLTQGGGIYFLNLNNRAGLVADVHDNVFIGNTCTDYGGAINVDAWAGSVSITANRCVGNIAGACAGAIYHFGGSASITIEDNLFVGNDSIAGSAIGLENVSGAIVRGNTFKANGSGAAIKLASTTNVTIDRNIVAFNQRGIRVMPGSSGTILMCNDVYANVSGDFPRALTGDVGRGNGNISEDPLFCNVAGDDYTLAEDSPCLPGGNTCAVQIGAFPMGCVEHTPTRVISWGAVKARFDRP